MNRVFTELTRGWENDPAIKLATVAVLLRVAGSFAVSCTRVGRAEFVESAAVSYDLAVESKGSPSTESPTN